MTAFHKNKKNTRMLIPLQMTFTSLLLLVWEGGSPVITQSSKQRLLTPDESDVTGAIHKGPKTKLWRNAPNLLRQFRNLLPLSMTSTSLYCKNSYLYVSTVRMHNTTESASQWSSVNLEEPAANKT
jgi:hypothetical protein